MFPKFSTHRQESLKPQKAAVNADLINKNLNMIGLRYDFESKRFTQVGGNPFKHFAFYTTDKTLSLGFSAKSKVKFSEVLYANDARERKIALGVLEEMSQEAKEINQVLDRHLKLTN